MIGTLYRDKHNDIYILLEVDPKEDTCFVFRNMRTLQERIVYGWGNFYNYFKPIKEEK